MHTKYCSGGELRCQRARGSISVCESKREELGFLTYLRGSPGRAWRMPHAQIVVPPPRSQRDLGGSKCLLRICDYLREGGVILSTFQGQEQLESLVLIDLTDFQYSSDAVRTMRSRNRAGTRSGNRTQRWSIGASVRSQSSGSIAAANAARIWSTTPPQVMSSSAWHCT